jgi:hypothetical protein
MAEPSKGTTHMASLAATRPIGGGTVIAVRVFHVPGLQPLAHGPWRHEADKLAWVDPATGLHCVILRASPGGHLCGYVGVDIGHAMFGWAHTEIPTGLGIGVHGGLDYSDVSDDQSDEAVAVRQIDVDGIDDPRWWFGFACDKRGDLVPDAAAALAKPDAMPSVYRDERFVTDQCTSLARRLALIDHAVDLLTNG